MQNGVIMRVFVSVLSAVVFSTTGFVYSSSIVDEVRCVLNTQSVDIDQATFDLSMSSKNLSGETKDKIAGYALAMRRIYEEINSSGCDEYGDSCTCGGELSWEEVLACGEAHLYDACCDFCGGASDDGDVLCEEIIGIARSCPQICSAGADPLAPFCGTADS
jgi:hypothetical protein